MIDVGIASAAMNVERKLHKKQKHDDRREDRSDDQVFLDRVQRVFDKDRVVADDPDLEIPLAASARSRPAAP